MTRFGKTTLAVGLVAAVLLIGAPRAATAAPLPVTIGNVLWLDASDASTITIGGGGVSQWADKSIMSNHFAQTDVNRQPATGANTLNSLNVLTFDDAGSQDYLTRAGVLAGNDDDYTYYTVFRPTKNAVMSVYEQASGGNGARSAVLLVNAKYGFNGQNNDKHDLVSYGPDQWRVSDMEINNAGGPNVSLYDNDVPYTGTTGNPGALNIGTTASTVGKKVTGNSEYFDGDIAEIIIYDRVLLPTERLAVRDYLDQKWALNDFAPPPPPSIDYDFDDDSAPGTPSLDGWAIISQGTGAIQIQAARSEANRMPNAPVLTTAFGTPVGGFIGDGSHVALIARSPSFEIDAAGDITWQSVGGNAGIAVDPGLGSGAYPYAAMGVSLVRASDGVRVLSTETAQQGTLTGYSFNITPYVNDGNMYYLEVVDNLRPDTNTGWGYVEWDNFSIPQAPPNVVPEPMTMLAVGLAFSGLGGYVRRRRRG